MSSWPRKRCTSVISMPSASSRVAIVCRSRCGWTRLAIAAARATSRTTCPTRCRVSTCGRSCTPLPAGEERARAAGADVQPQQLGELAPDRHLPPLAALAAADDDHPLGEADVLDPELDQLGDPRPGLEQGLQHEPGPPALGVGLVGEPQLLLERQPIDGAAALGRGEEAGLAAGGFEHRLALRVVGALAGANGGDCGR